MYKLEYFLRPIGDNKYAFDYKFYQNNIIIDEGVYRYCPWQQHDCLNSVRNTGRWALRTQLAKKYGVKSMQTICKNPESDFLTRAERRAQTAQKYKQERLEQKEQLFLGEPQLIKTKTSKERLYEVVEVGGVWTIKKHATKWFTAEEAKTQLFAKVVNG